VEKGNNIRKRGRERERERERNRRCMRGAFALCFDLFISDH